MQRELVYLALHEPDGAEHVVEFDSAYFAMYRDRGLLTWHIEVYGLDLDSYQTLHNTMLGRGQATATFTDRHGVTRSGKVIISRLQTDPDGGYAFLQGSGPLS